jgi:hypothetical protein
MKTEVEINGFEISIEDVEGKIEIKVEMGDEVVEELTLDPAEYEGGSEDEEELKAFGEDEEGEEGEDESEEMEEAEEGESMPEEEEDEMMGESIKSFGDMFPLNENSEEEKK